MFLPLKWVGLTTTLFLTLSSRAWAETAATGDQDLGTVMSGLSDVSTFYGLLLQYPKIMLQLPNYGGITIVAPNNEAFNNTQNWDPKNETLVTTMLLYHILQSTVSTDGIPEGPTTYASTLLTDPHYTNVTGGQKVLIDKQSGDVVVFTSGSGSRASLVTGDIPFKGGLIQVIDTLMTPPSRLETTMRDNYKDLVAFLSALYAADLVPSVADSSNITIFAPRNSAFQLLSGTLSALPKSKLVEILRYHIVPDQVLTLDLLTNNTALSTLASDNTTNTAITSHLLRAGNNIYVDSAQIIQPDILIANGVVHMISGVLNPDAPEVQPNPEIATQPPVFPLSGATSTGSRVATPFITALPCTSSCPVSTTSTTSESVTAVETSTSSSSTTVRTTSSKADAGGMAAARCTLVAAKRS